MTNLTNALDISNSKNVSPTIMDTLEKVAYDVETYYLWVIFVLGFPGNCAIIMTIIKISPARSLTVYIAILAIVDNLAILNKLIIFVLPDHGVHLGQFGCKFLGYLGNVLVTIANWLLVAMSVERFAAVWFPFKVGQTWTFRKSLLVVLLVCLPLCALFLPLLWMIRFVVDKEEDMVYCDIHEEYTYFMMHIWYWINVMVYAAIPCILLSLFNILIIAGLAKSGRTQKYLYQTKKKGNTGIDRHRPVTIMLVTSAVTLVILTVPRCVMLILTPYWTPSEDTLTGDVHYLIDTLAYVLCDSTHAVNFYVYSLSAKRFRRYLIDVFSCRRRKVSTRKAHYISLSFRSSSTIRMTPLCSQKHVSNPFGMTNTCILRSPRSRSPESLTHPSGDSDR